MKTDNSIYKVKKITALETYPVRHPILREGRPIADCAFDLDNHDSTFHLGLFFKNDLVGVASFMKNNHAFFEETVQYQLRGMAILQDYQNKGLGKELLISGEKEVSKTCSRLWFNAREIAVDFYKNCGYKTIGKQFDIKGIGAHFVMTKTLIKKGSE